APLDTHADAQRRFLGNDITRLVDEAAHVATAHVHADADVAASVLATDCGAAHASVDLGELLERHRDTAFDGDPQLSNLFDVVPRRQWQTHDHVEATGAFPVLIDRQA